MSDVEESAKLERVLHRFCGPRAWPESAFEALEREGGARRRRRRSRALAEPAREARLLRQGVGGARARAAVRMVLDADRGAVGVATSSALGRATPPSRRKIDDARARARRLGIVGGRRRGVRVFKDSWCSHDILIVL